MSTHAEKIMKGIRNYGIV